MLSIVWIAIQVIFKTSLVHIPAKNVLKIHLPTSVDGRLAIPAKLVKEVLWGVPHVPVATPVKPVQDVNHARQVNLAPPTMKTLLLARHAKQGYIKTIWAKLLVYHAYPEPMKTSLVQQNVKSAAKANIKLHPAIQLVWIAKWVDT